MENHGINYGLIEHMLKILTILKNDRIDIDYLTGKDGEKESDLLYDTEEVYLVYEVIRFMDEIPGGFFIYHADGDEEIIYANKGLLRIFHCDTMQEFRELTGNSFKGIVYHEDLDAVEESIREQIAESQYDLDYVEYRIRTKDGEVRWVDDYGHFIRNSPVGDIFYVFVGDSTDKRERQQKEKDSLMQENRRKEQKMQNLIRKYDQERQQINQEQLRRLEVIKGLSVNYESILYAELDSGEILPYRLSSRTRVQFDNKLQKRDYLWFVGNYVEVWVHPEDREMLFSMTLPEYIRHKLSEDRTYYVNYRVMVEDETQYIQLRIVNVGNAEHISQIVMGYRRVDEEIRREMEQKMVLETALSNANIAIVAKNTFLSNMSHDMRTPLNAIFGYTALARKNIHDSTLVQKYLDKIEKSSREFLDLIDKVLEISWTEADDNHIEETECNISDIIQDVYRMMLPQAKNKQITLALDTDDLEHGDVYADREKLKRLFLHLVSNAVIYTKPEGEVNVSLRELERKSNHCAVYQFVVQDTGIGISEDFIDRIFEPFEREQNTTFSGVHGTGLGLAIVRKIVDMMDGTIEVRSRVGQGSTFTVTLQLRIQEQPVELSIDTDYLIEQISRQTILLVEDNEINLEIEKEILQGLGFHLDTAVDGRIAVDKIKSSAPGDYILILMDIQMPVLDGRSATKEIRSLENEALAQIPIIALSADAFESDERMSISCGMDAHLTKPIDVPLLLHTMAVVVHNHGIIK